MIISGNAEEVLGKNPQFIPNRNSQQCRNRRELSQSDKGHLPKPKTPIANIILNAGRLNYFT